LLHSLASLLVRLENLAHVLAWSKSDVTAERPTVDLVVLPRQQLSFRVITVDGVDRLVCNEHAHLFVPLGSPSATRKEALKLLGPMPHGLLLQTEHEDFSLLIPNVKPHRPQIRSNPFSTLLVLERGNAEWKTAKNKSFLCPVHVSGFLFTPTVGAALYVLLLRWMARRYEESMELLSACVSDVYSEEDTRILDHLAAVNDRHPDCSAMRLHVELAVGHSRELPWDICEELGNYAARVAHVSARCRLDAEDEARVILRAQEHITRVHAIETQLKELQKHDKHRLKLYVELLQEGTDANAAQHRDLREWISRLVKLLRAQRIAANKGEIEPLVLRVLYG
jgi:hypothetical protein